MQLDVQSFPIQECDFLLLVSDGVADLCTNKDLLEIVFAHEAQRASEELVQLAQKRKSQDDLTAIVIDVWEMIYDHE